MKKSLAAFVFICFVFSCKAQIGLGVTTPHPNAYFQINSTNKGVLLPRMTALQRIAIAPTATANGLIVYDTDSTAYMYWTGTAWKKVGNDDGNWIKNGNNIYNSNFNTGFVGIGTNSPVARLHVADSPVVFTGPVSEPAGGSLSSFLQGAGTRVLWHPQKAAFRAGYVNGDQWNNDSIGFFSFATGYNAKAVGDVSVSLGRNTVARGFVSSALGFQTVADGFAATALGINTYAGGYHSLAAGNFTSAIGSNSFSMGSGAIASGNSSAAVGALDTASGDYSFATGFKSKAEGLYSFAAGNNAKARLDGSIAIGANAIASSVYSVAMGYGSLAQGNHSTSIGFENRAVGYYSVALGASTIASGTNAVSMGIATNASGNSSAAIGAVDTASGDYSFATGLKSKAEGIYSFAAGNNSKAQMDGAVAFGENSIASGGYSVAMGNGSLAQGYSSTSIGFTNKAAGYYSVALGNNTIASGTNSFSVGLATIASGNSSAVTGGLNTASGNYSFATGENTRAAGQRSFSMGQQIIAKAENSLVIGQYNDTTAANSIFEVGNGSSLVNRTNALTVLQNGHVGIGVIDPVSPLAFGSTTGQKITFWGSDLVNSYGIGVQGGLLQLHAAFTVDNIGLGFGSSSNFTERVRVQGNGNVGIGNTDPSYLLDVNNRMRIRSGGDLSNTAGLWLNRTDNAALQAFVGIESDNTVGFYGTGSGWSFTMNTNTGKVKIADGTQADGRVLTSDANGIASWIQTNSNKAAVNATFPGGGVNLTTAMGAAYTNLFIDLPPGKWLVIGTYLMSQGGSSLLSGQSMFVRTSFSSSNVANIATGDIIGSGLMSGNVGYPTPFGVLNGQNIINNTSGATKRYYVWAAMTNTGGQPIGFFLNNFCGNFWSENNLVALPMN
jgi:Head domain of trimeric autotransporter adhesin